MTSWRRTDQNGSLSTFSFAFWYFTFTLRITLSLLCWTDKTIPYWPVLLNKESCFKNRTTSPSFKSDSALNHCDGCMMVGTCERSQFSNHALNMFWFVSRIFFKSEIILTHPLGLLSLVWPNFNLIDVFRYIVSKTETILLSSKSKPLILFAISVAQVSHRMTESSTWSSRSTF